MGLPQVVVVGLTEMALPSGLRVWLNTYDGPTWEGVPIVVILGED